MSVSGTFSRNRQQQEEKLTRNPDLEWTQQGIANELYGPNATIGSWGMTGGQYPTAGKDRPGFGSQRFGNPWGLLGNKNLPQTTTSGGGSVPLTGPVGAGTGVNAESGPGPGAGGYGLAEGQGGAPPGGGLRYYGDPYAGGSSGARQIFGNVGFSGYQDLLSNPLLTNPGYDEATAQGIRTSSDVAARSPYERARFDIGRRAGLTGDTASIGPARAALAASEGATASDAARAADFGIANEKQRQLEAGLGLKAGALSGISGLYGQEGGLMQALLAQRGNLASLVQRRYTHGAGTSGSITGGYGGGG